MVTRMKRRAAIIAPTMSPMWLVVPLPLDAEFGPVALEDEFDESRVR